LKKNKTNVLIWRFDDAEMNDDHFQIFKSAHYQIKITEWQN